MLYNRLRYSESPKRVKLSALNVPFSELCTLNEGPSSEQLLTELRCSDESTVSVHYQKESN